MAIWLVRLGVNDLCVTLWGTHIAACELPVRMTCIVPGGVEGAFLQASFCFPTRGLGSLVCVF